MGRRQLGAVFAVIVVVVGVLAIVAIYAVISDGRDAVGAGDGPGVSVTAVPGVPRSLPGDVPPNHVDNRGHLRPGDVSPQARQRLAEQAEAMRPVLERLRASGQPSPEAVTEALVGLGHPRDRVSAVVRRSALAAPDHDPGPAVVFGVSGDGGCVQGAVWRDQVRLGVGGAVAEWGCLPPDTH